MHDLPLTIDDKFFALMERGYIPSASIEITRRCNAACKYCYLPQEKQVPEMTTAQVKLAVDKLFDAGVFSIGITGGEPLIRDDINELLEYICEKGFFFITLLTNGLLLTDRLVALLARFKGAGLGVRMSVFSLDHAVNDAFMGVKGALRRIIDNGEKLIAGGVKTGVLMNALEFNLNELPAAEKFFESKGFEFALGYEKSPVDPARYDLRPMMERDFLVRFLAAAPPDVVFYMINSFVQKMEADEAPETLCEGLKRTIGVFPNGDLTPCLSFRNLQIGNIVSDCRPLREILRSSCIFQKLKSLRRNDLEKCRDCEYKKFCVVCIGAMHNQDGDFLRPPQQTCNIAEALQYYHERHTITLPAR